MASTLKRVHIGLTKEDFRQLEELMIEFGESRSEVIKRALIILYSQTYMNNEETINESEHYI